MYVVRKLTERYAILQTRSAPIKISTFVQIYKEVIGFIFDK